MGETREGASARLQSQQITKPLGTVVFGTSQHTAQKLTGITHQVSSDNIHFQSVTPGQVLELPDPYWYRVLFERMDSNFEKAASPVALPGEDPALNPNYNLQNTATTDLGGGIIERTLNFATISGPVMLQETPLQGTLGIFSGPVPVSVALYTVSGNQITFTTAQTGITVQYQTSAYSKAGMPRATHSANKCTSSKRGFIPGVSLHCFLLPLRLSKMSQ